MFYNMGFSDDELKFLFDESDRVIKTNGLLSFSVRNDKDIMYKKGTKIAENIYDIDDFHILFFTKEDIKFFINDNFEIQKIIEGYEEPVGLYFVFLIITIFVLLHFLMEVSLRFLSYVTLFSK